MWSGIMEQNVQTRRERAVDVADRQRRQCEKKERRNFCNPFCQMRPPQAEPAQKRTNVRQDQKDHQGRQERRASWRQLAKPLATFQVWTANQEHPVSQAVVLPQQQTHTKVAQMLRPVAVANARLDRPAFLVTRENEGNVAKRVPKVG